MRSRLTALRRRLRQTWTRVRRRVGHRGAFLAGLAVLDYVSAYRLAWPERGTASTPSYAFLASLAPLWSWAILWAVVGTIALIHAFRAHDAIAYGCAMGLKVVWAAVYLLGWLAHGIPNGYFSVAIWVFAAWMVYVVATWPEPTYEPDQEDR